MQADMRDLEETVDRLLADPASQGLPLHQALAALMERHRHLLRQLERITYIADRYQTPNASVACRIVSAMNGSFASSNACCASATATSRSCATCMKNCASNQPTTR